MDKYPRQAIVQDIPAAARVGKEGYPHPIATTSHTIDT